MILTPYGLTVILGCALVTLIPRVMPIMFFSKFKIPEGLSRWLAHVPVAVMTALLVNELLIHDSKVNIGANLYELIVAIPTFIVAIKTKSPITTVAVGVIGLMLMRMFF